jgi:eukaryotic-like serine/threonine-protein kinase
VALTSGVRFGAYEILAPLGHGAMGEVYRARDTRLGRQVALKVLPEPFAADPDRLARFEREAQLLASMNHPNIAIIHGVEEAHGLRALVLELVEGPTLADRLAEGPMATSAALAIARQIADALESAHEHDIVHRDLKPANVKLRHDGTVKVLDFGLAKALDPVGGVERTRAPTITDRSMTRAGTVLGTAAYMSPEQATGKPVDTRADIWAFGCVLFEMLAGRRPFEGDQITQVLARVIECDPDWSALPGGTPRHVRRLLRRCLDKDPRRRLRDIGDARADLEVEPSAGDGESPAAPAAARPLHAWAMAAAASAALVALGVGWWIGAAPAPAAVPRVLRVLVDVSPADLLLGAHPLERTPFGRSRPSRTAIALSPDGRTLAFAARQGDRQAIYLRRLDADRAEPAPGTEGGDAPFFSPDGAFVAFWSGGALRRAALAGGPPVTIVDAPAVPMGASWSDDGRIVYEQRNVIWSVPSAGGEATRLTRRAADGTEAKHLLPRILPGGRWLLYTVLPTEFGWDIARVVAQSLETGERRSVLDRAADARYVPTGHLVYMRLGNLMAAPFNLDRLAVTGGETGLVEGVMQAVNASAIPIDTGAGQIAISDEGTLAFVPGGLHPDFEGAIVSIGRDGSMEAIPVPPPVRPYFSPRLSPDGRSLAVATLSLHSHDLWRYELAERTITRLTTAGRVEHPVWSHDGTRIAFALAESGTYNLFILRADGSGQPERLTEGQTIQFPSAWTPDDTALVFYEGGNINVVSVGTPSQVRVLLATPFFERMADVSPDGRWLAYVSDETGQAEVYVQAFPDLGSKRRISIDGGIEPAWSRDGRRLVYLSPRAPEEGYRVVELPVATGEVLTVGRAATLFDVPWYTPAIGARAYDLTPDASRFVFVRETYPPAASAPREIHLVLHWFEELRRRAPAP